MSRESAPTGASVQPISTGKRDKYNATAAKIDRARSPARALQELRIAFDVGLEGSPLREMFLPHIESIEKALRERAPDEDERKKITLRQIAEVIAEQREPEWLLPDVLEAYVLAVMAGRRGSFKSFVAVHWALQVALSGMGVVILSGEGAGLDRRADAGLRVLAPGIDRTTLRLAVLELPLNLTLPAVRARVAAAVAELGWPVALIVIDTASKYSAGLDENENAEVAQWLFCLATEWRDQLRSTVLLVTHTGHGDGKRTRGASAWEANTDAAYVVERPDAQGMTCTVSRERFKDTPSLPPLAYTASVYDLGRIDKRGQPVTSLVLTASDAPPPAASGQRTSASQRKVLAALVEWARSRPEASHITTMELRDLLKGQGITARSSQQDARTFLATAGYCAPSVGGYAVNREQLL